MTVYITATYITSTSHTACFHKWWFC